MRLCRAQDLRIWVSIGEVGYFKGICEEAGLDEETVQELHACVAGKDYFATQELLNERGVTEPYRSILLQVADMFGSMTSLEEAKKLVKNKRSLAAIERLEKIYKVLELYGVEEHVSFDLGMLSKYNYYTGVIFKAFTYGVGDAIVKGGRYNNLLSKFGKNAPAIGFVIVIDDVMAALSRQKVKIELPEAKRTITYRPRKAGDFQLKLQEVKELRSQGICVEFIPEI